MALKAKEAGQKKDFPVNKQFDLKQEMFKKLQTQQLISFSMNRVIVERERFKGFNF